MWRPPDPVDTRQVFGSGPCCRSPRRPHDVQVCPLGPGLLYRGKVRYLAGRTGEGSGIGSRQFSSILDVEANGTKIALVHPAVHGEAQQLAFAFEIVSECRKSPVGPAVVSGPVHAQAFLCRVKAANDVRGALEGLVAARLRMGD